MAFRSRFDATRLLALPRLRLPAAMRSYAPMLMLLCMSLTSCTVVKGIFKAGVWVGVLSVFAVVGLVIFGLTRLRR